MWHTSHTVVYKQDTSRTDGQTDGKTDITDIRIQDIQRRTEIQTDMT